MSQKLIIYVPLALLIAGVVSDLAGIFNAPVAKINNSLIRVESPRPGQVVKNPLVITGQARGLWYFEATFPVRLVDSRGVVIAVGHAETQSDWMTDEFVPFRASLSFEEPGSSTGLIILEKSNPSGLPENDDAVQTEVRF